MGLEEVQIFLTTYLRDPEFREGYRRGEAEALEGRLNLSRDDVAFVRSIDLDDLDRSAAGFREERMDKRRTEFEQFFDHLGAYGPVDAFFADYDRENPSGLLTRPLEMDRFLDYSTRFIVRRGLPEYLIDLLRFCYHYVQLADRPLGQVARELTELPETGLRAYHRVQLHEPHRLVNFRYDVLNIARSEPSQELAYLQPQPTELFMQKSRRLYKRTQIVNAAQLPFLSRIAGGPTSVLELVSSLPSAEMAWAVGHLEHLHGAGMVAVTLPSHFTEQAELGAPKT